MAVPTLNFATMPIINPRSEIEGFSNALLNAGSMRQQRLEKAEASKRAEEQRRFENEMAMKSFGLQEKADVRADRAATLDERRFGLQEKQYATAEKEAEQRLAQGAITTEEMKQQQAFEAHLKQPEIQAIMKSFKDKGDVMGLLNFLEQSATATGASVPSWLFEVANQRTQILQEQRNKIKDEAQLRLIDAQIATEGAQKKKYLAEAQTKAGMPISPEFLQKERDYALKQQENIEGMIKPLQNQIFTLESISSKAPTDADIATWEASATPNSPELRVLQEYKQAMSGNDQKAKAVALQQLKARLEPLIRDRKQQLYTLEQTRDKNIAIQNSYTQFLGGIPTPTPPSFGIPSPANNAPAPQPGGPVLDMLGLLGEIIGKGNQLLRVEDYLNTLNTGFNKKGQATLDQFRKGVEGAKDKPISKPETPARPSKATPAYTTGYNR